MQQSSWLQVSEEHTVPLLFAVKPDGQLNWLLPQVGLAAQRIKAG